MALTDWSISEETVFTISHILAPFYICNTIASNIFNSLIVIATIRSTKLRNFCNLLIALQAASDGLLTWSDVFFIYNAYTHRFITIHQCFLAQIVPWIIMNFTTCLILLIGVDRLICVKYVGWYYQVNKIRYFTLLMAPCVAYSTLVTISVYATTTDHKVLCFMSDVMAGRGKDVWACTQAILNGVVIVVYAKLKNALETQTTKPTNDNDTRKIFKSLYLIVVFYIFGWVTSITLLLAVRLLIADPLLEQAAGHCISTFAAMSLLMPFLVYFTQSSVYRIEILRLFFNEERLERFAPATNVAVVFSIRFFKHKAAIGTVISPMIV